MNPSDEKGQVKLTARGSQVKWTKFHSELFRRHPIKCLAHCSLITSHKHDHTNSKDVIDIEAQNPSTQKVSQFQRLFCKLQVQWWQWWCLPTAAW